MLLSLYSPKETPIFYNLWLRFLKIKPRVSPCHWLNYISANSEVPKVSFVKAKTLIGKEWDPENYIGDIQIDPNDSGVIEP